MAFLQQAFVFFVLVPFDVWLYLGNPPKTPFGCSKTQEIYFEKVTWMQLDSKNANDFHKEAL